MKKTKFLRNLKLDEKIQISPQLAQQMKPLLFDDENLEDRKRFIQLYLSYHKMIIEVGEIEHSNDWDPAIKIKLKDGTVIGDEAGFDIAQLNDDKLLIESPNADGEYDENDNYITVPILEISEISYYYH